MATIILINLVGFLCFTGALAMFELGIPNGALRAMIFHAWPPFVAWALTGLIPPEWKARLIFLRWENPLPGSEAFTTHGPRDERVDMQILEDRHGPLPDDPRGQNKLWYRMYKSVEHDSSVRHTHTEFLLVRDWYTLALVLLVLGSIGYRYITSEWDIWYPLLLIAQVLMAWWRARYRGVRFVTTVLASKSAQ